MNYINDFELNDVVNGALKEDVGRRDITTKLIIPKNKLAKAVLLAKQDCVICGLGIASLVFKTQDKNIKFRPLFSDGELVKKGKSIARISGRAASILTAERVALNFLALLSGISTQARKFVDAVKPCKVKIMDTRKTIPGLRILQKYAVRIGGGFNHRMSLDEMVLVKDNHLKVLNPKSQIPNPKQIPNKSQIPNLDFEIEVTNLKGFKEALKLKPDIIMLDNMSIADMKEAVKIRDRRPPSRQAAKPPTRLEASGGITLKNIKQIAATGVDWISIGALTHSVSSVDISLEIL